MAASISLLSPATAAAQPNCPPPPCSETTLRGPDPTEASIGAETGTFNTTTIDVPKGTIQGMGGATIFAPTGTGNCKYGAVIIQSGMKLDRDRLAWYGPRVASQGFVVMTMDANSENELPAARARLYPLAIDYLTKSSQVKDTVDANRLAVSGWSFGGGAALDYSRQNSKLKASIPLTPWELPTSRYDTVQTPTLIFGAESDDQAPANTMPYPFYRSLPANRPKAYLELKGAEHDVVATPNPDTAAKTTIAKTYISWLKRFVDSDGRYDQFLWPRADTEGKIARYEFVKQLAPPAPPNQCPSPSPTPTRPPTSTPPSSSRPPAPAPGGGQVGIVPIGAPETGDRGLTEH
ncbi:dienelactone hydrolase family protein [Herbihabitans rhizosphaerae]|nr:dienelactone hydrolase family protein [Herbihabitans rhizosphaerae]